MKFTIRLQVAILMCLYLARSGRTKTEAISEELKISRPTLDQVAHRLKKHGVLKSFRGPGGGYELSRDVTLRQVFSAISPIKFLQDERVNRYVTGTPEERALAYITRAMSQSTHPVLSRTINMHMLQLVGNEVSILNKLNEESVES
jgi:Rrf2 family protein